jgi:hypothetical protein
MPRERATAPLGPAGSRQNGAPNTERTNKMLNTAKVKQLKAKRKEIVFTTLWVALALAALLFIAVAGHV